MFEISELWLWLVAGFLAVGFISWVLLLKRRADTFDPDSAWHGYADAKPSESIFDLELPGLAVATVFPYKPGQDLIEPPVRQYKDCKGPKRKARRADELAEWLKKQKKAGLDLRGFVHSHSQLSAAKLGMDLIEELPDTRVEPHYDGYRLFFGDEHIDFGHAVALEYYFFTISFGILFAGMAVTKESRKLLLLMDRFPGVESGGEKPGVPSPPTEGEKFLHFVATRSKTGIGFEDNNKSKGLDHRFGSLKWWKKKTETEMKKGKTHPHFIFPDWLAAATIAENHPVEMAATFENKKAGANAVKALRNLHSVFRSFKFFSMDENVLGHLRGEAKLWDIPDEIRADVLSRADPDAP